MLNVVWWGIGLVIIEFWSAMVQVLRIAFLLYFIEPPLTGYWLLLTDPAGYTGLFAGFSLGIGAIIISRLADSTLSVGCTPMSGPAPLSVFLSPSLLWPFRSPTGNLVSRPMTGQPQLGHPSVRLTVIWWPCPGIRRRRRRQ